MTAIVTSLLGGGWGLVAGWILPTALNALFFAALVLPGFRGVPVFHAVLTASHPAQALVLLVVAVVGGLMLSAFQTPLYRLLEGYWWPHPIRRKRIAHYQQVKTQLEADLRRARLTRLIRLEELGTLTGTQVKQLARLRSTSAAGVGPAAGPAVSAIDIGMLAERLRRFPGDDDQVLPTRLGNAIRRFEVYGYDRYRLDVIPVWYALTGVVPDQVRKQADASRASVDFFVCLSYGHLAVGLAAIAALILSPAHPVGPASALVLAFGLVVPWYWLAVTATDEWAVAVRGLVDIGRKPLAESLGLELPGTLEDERRMWGLVGRQARRPYDKSNSDLDRFRVRPGAETPAIPMPRGRGVSRTSYRPK